MKNQLFLCALLCLLWFNSCQTKKQFVKSETEIKTVSELNTSKEVVAKTDTQAVSTFAGSVTETDSTFIEETITELSKPDSLGQQYAEKIIKRQIISGKNKTTKVVEEIQLKQTAESEVSETVNLVTEQVISNETEVKTKIKKYIPWKLIVVIVFVAVIGFLIWSRFFRKLTGKFPLL
ncbi:hypothetical protein [Mangrovibacterium sp.]|uniref:hypothetical protein n=1 Tax=Mangrovibacterium sp. TaxID=1961364 RepID=UPI003569B9CB